MGHAQPGVPRCSQENRVADSSSSREPGAGTRWVFQGVLGVLRKRRLAEGRSVRTPGTQARTEVFARTDMQDMVSNTRSLSGQTTGTPRTLTSSTFMDAGRAAAAFVAVDTCRHFAAREGNGVPNAKSNSRY
jgi:hypothetical protein